MKSSFHKYATKLNVAQDKMLTYEDDEEWVKVRVNKLRFVHLIEIETLQFRITNCQRFCQFNVI